MCFFDLICWSGLSAILTIENQQDENVYGKIFIKSMIKNQIQSVIINKIPLQDITGKIQPK
jgi:hypothetical protein